jgi:hypothetical protein
MSSSETRPDDSKLFDWKKAGTYSWKAHFPLGMRDGSVPAGNLPQKAAAAEKKQ